MTVFLDDDWCEMVLGAAEGLSPVDGLSFSFDVEVTESASGKVRAHGAVENGRLVSFASGKFVPETKGDSADVSFVGKAKRLVPLVTGETPALVAYMRGELKVDGAYELVIDQLANRADRAELEAFRAEVAENTTW